jgi:hypothetical protein
MPAGISLSARTTPSTLRSATGGECAETDFAPRPLCPPMADIVMLGILALLLLFVFFVYLMVRRTVTGFKEGVEDGQKGR